MERTPDRHPPPSAAHKALHYHAIVADPVAGSLFFQPKNEHDSSFCLGQDDRDDDRHI